jgi:hypothetical protein
LEVELLVMLVEDNLVEDIMEILVADSKTVGIMAKIEEVEVEGTIRIKIIGILVLGPGTEDSWIGGSPPISDRSRH